MGPEILIVGDRAVRGELVPRVQDLGYSVSPVRERELLRRVARSPGPAAVIVCLGEVDATGLVQALRQSPEGSAVPVLLYGRLQGEIRDLADVLELGADRFLEAPVADAELVTALAELAGPAEVGARPDAVREEPPIERPDDRPHPVLGTLHRTLEVLAARLETRDEAVDGPGDGIDLEAMGLDAVPDVDPEHDSGELELLRESTQRLPPRAGPRGHARGEATDSGSRTGRWGPRRELTFSRGEEISPGPDGRRSGEANDEHTALVATAAREDVRKERSTRWRGPEAALPPRPAARADAPEPARGSERSEEAWSKRHGPGDMRAIEPTARLARGAEGRGADRLSGGTGETGEGGRRFEDGERRGRLSGGTGETGEAGRRFEDGERRGRLSGGTGETGEAGRRFEDGERRGRLSGGTAVDGAARVRGRFDAELGVSGRLSAGTGLTGEGAGRPGGAARLAGETGPGEGAGRLPGSAARSGGVDGGTVRLSGGTGTIDAARPGASVPGRTVRMSGGAGSAEDASPRAETGDGTVRLAGRIDPEARGLGRLSSRTGAGVAAPSGAGASAPSLPPLGPPETRGESDAPALLAELRRERFTGCLQVPTRAGAERRLWWSEGQVIGGASAAASESVLGRLAARGLIGSTQLELAVRWSTGDPRRDVERLAQTGLIKPQEMQEALREPVRRVVERIAEAGTIAWALHPGESPAVQVELGVPLTSLIAGGIRRGAALAQLREAVGDGRRPRLSFAGPEALAAELRWPEVAAIAGRFDGRTSVGELIAEAVADEAEVRAAVYVLGLLGHLAPEVEDPEASLQAVDRRRVRERLRLARENDYFALLGLSRDATRAEVLQAHADLSATFREGLEPGSRALLAEEVEEVLAALDEARDVLADDALHTAYLAQLAASSGPGGAG